MNTKNIFLGALVIVICGAIWYLQKPQPMPGVAIPTPSSASESAQQKAGKYPRAVELAGAKGWINSEPFTLASLTGKKVVLLDFWTYSCINCLRTIPYLNQWYAKYKDKGLVIIGVHSPEFEFEKDMANVQAAVKKLGIQYPVMLDSDMATWGAWSNQYWPNEYLIDVDGYVVHSHSGEGQYDETEKEIQKALNELMVRQGMTGSADAPMATPADVIPVDFGSIKSPELYLGAHRNGGMLGNAQDSVAGNQVLVFPQRINANKVYLDGTWQFTDEYVRSSTTQTRIRLRYNAKQVNIVAGSAKTVHFTVMRDGKAIGAGVAGADATNGSGTVSGQRLYELIDDAKGYGEHTIDIIIDEPGLDLFTFTFG